MAELLLLDPSDPQILTFLRSVDVLSGLTDTEIRSVAGVMTLVSFRQGEYVFKEGETGSSLFLIKDGACCLEVMGRTVKLLHKGDLFGEIAAIDRQPRTATVRTIQPSRLLSLAVEDMERSESLSPVTNLKLYKAFARQLISYMRHGDALYSEIDVLLIQDGGCAPGYDSVTAYLTRYLENAGRQVFMAREGFKSLVSGTSGDFCCLINNRSLYLRLEQLPGVIFTPPLREARGASFRTERYKEFVQPEIQRKAAHHILERNINVLVGIGGNGTFAGINALSRLLPDSIQTFFVPVTIDSDIYGTECIGEHTGVQVGSEKIHGYMADARTHRRIYIIEMMGAEGGYHALHSCLGAGADLAVLPSSRYDPAGIVAGLKKKECAVIVVSEGYKRDERRAVSFSGNAAEYLYQELLQAGLDRGRRVVCEGFSRDIRGSAPNYRDITLSQRMARLLTHMMLGGRNREMPAILAGREYAISFDDIRTDNSVESGLADLANRLDM
jgi:6-phosphofructokinase